MSPLWPKTVSVGLFPGDAWLRHRGLKTERSYRFESSHDPNALLKAMDAMFEECSESLGKGAKLDVTVSDSVAAVSPLPWRDNLYRRDELNSYARINFEKANVEIDGNWAIHTEFPHFRKDGISYALPKAWLSALDEVAGRRGLSLRSVMPNSARQYFRAISLRKNRPDLLLLREAHRISALVMEKGLQLHYDIEPLTSSSQDSLLRVVQRISANFGERTSIGYWTSEARDVAGSIEFLKNSLPKAELKLLARSGKD